MDKPRVPDEARLIDWAPVAITVISAILDAAYRVLDRRQSPPEGDDDPISELVQCAERIVDLLRRYWSK